MHVQAGSELDGMQMFELSTQTRVIAITRDDVPGPDCTRAAMLG